MPHTPVNAITSVATIREALLNKHEIVLLDVREEDNHAQGHPLFATNIALSRLELDIYQRIPHLDTQIVVFDGGENLAERAIAKLQEFGYSQVTRLEHDLAGWEEQGGELFRDVNSASKAFGELVAHQQSTPMLSPEEVKQRLDNQDNIVVLDVRRFDEYQTMNIPGSVSTPGAELVLRIKDLAPDPTTQIIINCAGRTRSIIGTQSLVNAHVPNPVAALRNGTIGWTLAGQELQHSQNRHYTAYSADSRTWARQQAASLAEQAGVKAATAGQLEAWRQDKNRTTFFFDVRSPDEYLAGTLAGFSSAPGGQLVQETDFFVAVRGARLVLLDDDGVRARMTASWLAQMNWETWVVDGLTTQDLTDKPPFTVKRPEQPNVASITPVQLQRWLDDGETHILDLTTSANYQRRHIPGAHFAIRAHLPNIIPQLGQAKRIVVTCGSSLLARYAVNEVAALTDIPVFVLEGGNQAWFAAGFTVEEGPTSLLSPLTDRYRRPYEGTDNPVSAMQGYLEWEYGLVDQLDKDGTHGFFVISPGQIS